MTATGATGPGPRLVARGARLAVAVMSLASAAVATVSTASGGDVPAGGMVFEEPVVRTEHAIEVAGSALRYAVETGRIAIRDVETGEPHGFMFYTAYRVPSETVRPLTFVWNGGPGANASLLHFEAAGPRRLQDGALVDNQDTWLTTTDLVFVDPVGTGFSRPAKAEYAAEFYGTIGDVASVTEFVRAWRALHGAERAPLLLAGESWGAGRAGQVGFELGERGIPVHALVLISGGAGLNDDPLPGELRQALRVADLSATAVYHDRVPEPLRGSAAEIRRQAETWARETYAPALARPGQLDEAERAAVVAGLARFTGLPEDAVDRETLAITPRGYREALLRDSETTVQIFDMRLTSADAASSASGRTARAASITRYLRHELGYRTSLPYIDLEPIDLAYAPAGEYPQPVGYRWNYATAELPPEEVEAAIQEAIRKGDGPPKLGPPLPSAAEAVQANPELRVLVAAGRYDALNSCTANAERARRLKGALRQAYTFQCYEGGHMMYRDPAARTALAGHVRALAETAE